MDAPISGRCDERFGAVKEEFVHNFAERGELGAALCVIVEGSTVIDLVGGWADEERHRTWQPDTLVDFYSVGKAFVALLALRAVDAGRLDLDEPLTAIWPEFGAGGKDSATLRHALCHRAGVPAIRRPLTDDDLWDWATMADAVAATEAWWEPGARHAYHTNTYGHLVGEVACRAGGATCAQQLAELAGPLGADVSIGASGPRSKRCADVMFMTAGGTEPIRGDGPPDLTGLSGDELMEMLSYFNPPGYSSIGVVNSAAWRHAEVPSTNGHGTAKGVARLYGALLQPGRLLSSELLAEATRPQSQGYCPILHDDVVFGLGFTPTSPRRPFGPNPRSFGHFGTGGAVGFADPEAGIAFGYVMNHVIPRWQSTRNRALMDALYAAL